jgi:prevent-host-death family protein
MGHTRPAGLRCAGAAVNARRTFARRAHPHVRGVCDHEELQVDVGLVAPHAGSRDTIWPDVAMKRVKIAELKDQLSKHLRAVEQGAEVEVTDRDRPIARIVPVPDTPVAALPPKRPFSSIRRKRYRRARWGSSSTDLLLEERQRR